MRITLWIPVTPARVSETRTRGAEACTSCRSATSSLAGRLTPRIVRALRADHLQLPATSAAVINRLLRIRREPASIFEHIDAHVRSGVAGLAEGGHQMPDDEEIVAAPAGADAAGAAVERIYAALVKLAAKPNSTRHQRVRELFREGDVRGRIDALRDRLGAEPPPHADRLYPELHDIFLRSGYRDEVKYAMALMSGFGRREDADLFRVIGRHEEFTLYAAVALATVSDDPFGDWLALLPQVERAGPRWATPRGAPASRGGPGAGGGGGSGSRG